MPRKPRIIEPGHVYHVLNRASHRLTIFQKPQDYDAFLRTLEQAHAKFPIRILAFVLMPNHFHLVLWPHRAQTRLLSTFMRWLQVTHTQRHHAHYHTAGTGHLYQGRFKSFPVQSDHHLTTLLRYVEQNPLRAHLCKRAELWPHSSLHLRLHGSPDQQKLLAPWPQTAAIPPKKWLQLVNTPPTPTELAPIHQSLTRGSPLGSPSWTTTTAHSQNLQHTLRPRGRPKLPKENPKK